METVKLKNGSEMMKPIFMAIAVTLNQLYKIHGLAFLELVKKCRTPNHEMFGKSEQLATEYNLMEDGQVLGHVRDIVLSEVEGEGFGLTLSERLYACQPEPETSFFQNSSQPEVTDSQNQQHNNLKP